MHGPPIDERNREGKMASHGYSHRIRAAFLVHARRETHVCVHTQRADGQRQAILGFHRCGEARGGGAGAGQGTGGAAGRDWVPGQGGQDGRRAPSSLDPTSAAAAAPGGVEDEEATYEFVVGDGVVESENGGATGRGWSSWGSRLAATGSGGRLSG